MMITDAAAAVLEIAGAAIQRIWPDPQKQAEEQRRLAALAQKGDLAGLKAEVQILLAQIQVNKIEARSKSMFVAGWRPFIGWCGGVALAYQFVAYPLLLWCWQIATAFAIIPDGLSAPPVLDSGALWTVVAGMLGIGGMRSYDKRQGTQTDNIRG